MIAVEMRVSGKKRELLLALVVVVVVGSCVGGAVGLTEEDEVMRDLGEERRRRSADGGFTGCQFQLSRDWTNRIIMGIYYANYASYARNDMSLLGHG